jgi:hypothetical protein
MRVSPREKCDTCEFFPGRNRYRRVSPREKCDWAAIYKHNLGGVLLMNGVGLSQSDGNFVQLAHTQRVCLMTLKCEEVGTQGTSALITFPHYENQHADQACIAGAD